MELIRGLHNFGNCSGACVATIGNFDGVHLGHQKILDQLKYEAMSSGLQSAVIIFEPQPIEFFAPERAPSRLTRLREKLEEFQRHDIDRVLCISFDEALANLSADDFIKQILVDGLKIKEIIVGDDFRFAKNREGDFNTLKNAGKQHGFNVEMMETFVCDDERISSTLIRQYLADGEIEKANRMLGRPYRITGRVIHGEKRGRDLGFPTANIELKRYLSPVHGIFSGRVHGLGEAGLDAVVYVGSRPVFNGEKEILEVHILDFNHTIYGERIQVEFIEKLRGDENFDSGEELIEQINKDIEKARISLQTR